MYIHQNMWNESNKKIQEMVDIGIIQGMTKTTQKIKVYFPVCIIDKPTCLIHHTTTNTEDFPIGTRIQYNFNLSNITFIQGLTSVSNDTN